MGDSPLQSHGELIIGDGWASWSGAVGPARAHRHFAAQAVVSDSLLMLWVQGRAAPASTCHFIEPLTSHRVGPSDFATVIFIEPRASAARTLPDSTRRYLLNAVSPGEGPFWQRWRTSMPAPIDEWESSVQTLIDAQLVHGDVSSEAVAPKVFLSNERFRPLFTQRIGMPFERFVVWRRLRSAALQRKAGASATVAAQGAGFADAAQLERAIRRTFGVATSHLDAR